MRDRLNQIRVKSDTTFSIPKKLFRVFYIFVLGAIFGLLAKYADGWSFIGDIGSALGVWIFIAAIVAAWSRSPKAAAVHVVVFFEGMLISYYIYSMILFGFFTKSLFLSWSIFALFSSIGAYIVWYARGNGWIAALCGALPIAFLLAEGHSFYYYPAVTQGFDLFFALILFVILPTNKLQHLRLIPFVVFVFIVLLQSHLITIVFGNMWYYVRNILLS